MLKKTIKLSGILFLIAFATALLLGLTNEATKGIIVQRQIEAKNAAMSEVISAEKYILLHTEHEGHDLYGAFNGNDLIGYAVSLTESGYAGDISMIVGISKDGTVSGVSITEMSETPGLGDNAKKPEFTDRFKGLKKDEDALKDNGGKIQALSGATITSKAVTRGVARALEVYMTKVDVGGLKK